MLGDHENEVYYLQRESDSHKNNFLAYRSYIQKELNRTLEKDNEEKLKLRRKNFIIILVSSLLFVGVLIFFWVNFQRIRQNRRAIIKVKEQEIDKSKNEIAILQGKINESFSDLIQLAKENSPHFWFRFQEIYPNFMVKMLEVNPNLKVTELTFLAYIYLGFTTKEIASYTFKSPKTIENNRYNLRKRLALKSDEDLLVWLKNIVNN